MSLKLYVNHWLDPAILPDNAANEEALYTCFKDRTITDPAVGFAGFMKVPMGPIVDNGCPNNH